MNTSTPTLLRPPAAIDLTSRASFRFFQEDKLRFADIDRNGHVNNVAFLIFFENARVRFLEDHTPVRRGEHLSYMLVHLDIDYRTQLFYPGVVEGACRVVEVRRSSLVLGQALFSGEQAAATGHAVMVTVDRRINKAVPFPDEVRAQLEAMAGE